MSPKDFFYFSLFRLLTRLSVDPKGRDRLLECWGDVTCGASWGDVTCRDCGGTREQDQLMHQQDLAIINAVIDAGLFQFASKSSLVCVELAFALNCYTAAVTQCAVTQWGPE
eukprot:1123539-Rhodomonas_salina.1